MKKSSHRKASHAMRNVSLALDRAKDVLESGFPSLVVVAQSHSLRFPQLRRAFSRSLVASKRS